MENSLDTRSFYKTVFALFIPMALQNLVLMISPSIVTIMLGMINETYLAAVNFAGQVQFILQVIFFGLSSGTAILVAQYWGKKDTRSIEIISSIVLRISLFVALIFFLAAELFPRQIMRIFTPDTEIISLGANYLRIVAPSYLIVGFTLIYLNLMRSIERVMISVVVSIVSLFSNVLFVAVFVIGFFGTPRLGVTGVALSLNLTRIIELIIVSVYVYKNPAVRLRWKDFLSLPRTLFADFVQYVTPSTINELIWSLAIAVNAVIIGHLGSSSIAAYAAYVSALAVREIASAVGFGAVNTTAVLIGKAIGARQIDLAKKTAHRMLRFTISIAVFSGLLVLLFSPLIPNIMKLSPEGTQYLRFLLLLTCAYIPLQAINATLIVGVFRSGGDARFPMYVDLFVMWFFCSLPAALAAFVFHAPVKIVYLIILCDELIKVPICLIRYRQNRWLRDVTR